MRNDNLLVSWHNRLIFTINKLAADYGYNHSRL